METKPKILLFQNSEDLDLLKLYLENAGFAVDAVREAAIEAIGRKEHDLYVLDYIDHENRFDCLDYLRSFDTRTPAIFISDMDNADYVSVVLDKGADDCLRRPFNYNELVSRIRAMLRRTGLREKVTETVYRIGLFTLDMENRTLSGTLKDTDGKPFGYSEKLRVKECRLLALLRANAGKLVTKKEIAGYLWDEGSDVKGLININIHRLRQFLAPDPDVRLKNVHGVGYVLEC